MVPNRRNMILLALAVGYADSIGARAVYYGAHSGDHLIYPDCRPEFVQKMNDVCQIANYEPVDIVSPYLHQTKMEILHEGLRWEDWITVKPGPVITVVKKPAANAAPARNGWKPSV